MATYASIKYNFTLPTATTSSQGGAGAMTLIKSITSDGSDATISFVDGTSDVVLDSTYKTYLFKFSDIHAETNFRDLAFQGNVAGGADYNETITSTTFEANRAETSGTQFQYSGGTDQGQGTAFQSIHSGNGNENDESSGGELWLFNPSNTTFVTHFLASGACATDDDKTRIMYTAGYFNTTAAIDEIQFKFSSGEIQGGTIKLYGIA